MAANIAEVLEFKNLQWTYGHMDSEIAIRNAESRITEIRKLSCRSDKRRVRK